MKPAYIIGIDNGLEGGLAMLRQSDGALLYRQPMPILHDITLNCKRIDSDSLAALLRKWRDSAYDSRIIWTPMVAAEPCPKHSKDKASMRSMAFSWGLIVAAVSRVDLHITPIDSGRSNASWQTCLLGRLKKGGTKPAAIALARKLWPEESFIAAGCRTPHTGMVDAALIAEHLRRIHS